MVTAQLKQGSCIGPYQLERRLGAGGMAEVFLARRLGPHGFSKRVAIKRILPEVSRDPHLCQMFCDEARLAAALSHPNIAQVLDFGEHEGELFIVMEWVDGVSCSTLLKTVVDKQQRFPLGPALRIAREVLTALAFAHAARDESGKPLSIVHRDVSPSNILVSRTGDVKLIDFGITRSRLAARRTIPGELKGKLRYMSPEQVIGGSLDGRSDLFAVGIVLAEMLAGRSLFGGQDELDMLMRLYRGDLTALDRVHLAADVRAVLTRALAHRPSERFQSARQFVEAINGLARTAGLELDDAVLVPWLHSLGVLPGSGTRQRAELKLRRPGLGRGSERPTLRSQGQSPSQGESAALVKERVPRARVVTSVRAQKRSCPAALQPPRVPMETAEAPAPRVAAGSRSPARLRNDDRDSLTPTAVSVASPSPGPRAALPPPPPSPEVSAYRIKSQLGAVVGPVTRSDVLAMMATGRVASDSLLSVDDTGFLPAADIPELGPMARRPAYRFHQPATDPPDWAVPLHRATLPRVLFSLAVQRRSGLLLVADGQRQKRVYLEHGDPVFVASTQPDELLGHRLVRAGAVDPSMIDLALRSQPPLRLGEALVALHAIKPPYLLRQLVLQLEERFSDVFTYKSGTLTFYPGAEHGEVALKTHLPTLELITRAVRKSFEPAEIGAILGPLAERPVTRGPRYRALAPLLALSAGEQNALRHAPAAPSMRSLARDLSRQRVASRAETLRALFIGLSAGLLRAQGWPKLCVSGRAPQTRFDDEPPGTLPATRDDSVKRPARRK